jgi:N-acetyl-1-D-myo-inositol-2-amino-2-deoxy-alpha-D-glucopyranoside deacetylase
VAKLYWAAIPRSVMAYQLEAMKQAGTPMFLTEDSVDEVSFVVDDELVTTAIDGTAFQPAKMAALAEHRTQITVDGPFFALSNDLGRTGAGVEYFRLIAGVLGAERDSDGRETDLFAGLDVT